MNNKEIFKKIELLENEVLELKNTFLKSEIEPKAYELFLEVDEKNNLKIIFINKIGVSFEVGRIRRDGMCFILSTDIRADYYNEWVTEGSKVKEDNKVSWKSGVYQVSNWNGAVCLNRKDIECGSIYDFKFATASTGCKDTNINRHKHNNTPILY